VDLSAAFEDLAAASRILADQGVFDAARAGGPDSSSGISTAAFTSGDPT
jgi:hypothetical protein